MLTSASRALTQVADSLDQMRAEIDSADAQHTALQKRIDDLQATAQVSDAELKKILAAVNYRPRWQSGLRRLGGFLLGVLTTIVATVIAGWLPSRP